MWGLPSTEKIHSAEDWFVLLGYDADSSIPEEDLNDIQQLINTPVAYSDVSFNFDRNVLFYQCLI